MKTKFYLGALCLPLAFAACTNEEFESPINSSLENRGSIDVVLTAEKPAVGLDTRMSIDENNNFLWEAGTDMIGAALVDGASENSVGDNVYVNYPFVADANGQSSTFTGKSSMTQGLYFFYYGYQDVLDRGKLPLNMPVQEYDPAQEKTAIQQASTYMKMISPIVKLEDGVKYAEVDQYNLNLAFANLYTMVKVNISSKNIPTGVTPSVTKVTLDGNAGSGSTFVNKANAKLTASTGIADAGILELTDAGTLDADKQATALVELEEMITNGSTSGIYQDVTCGASVLNVKEGCNLSSDGEVALYILAPKGTYTNLILTVETSEGVYTRTVTKAAGIELGNNIQPIAADLDFAQDGTGNVTLPASFSIASTEEWTSAVDFMTAHAVGYLNKTVTFTLTKDITIDNLPVFNLKIDGGKTLTLKKDYTINANNAAQFTGSNVTLGVAEGATLTVTADPTSFTAIKNYGTLNVTGTSVSKKITNLGQMNINADAAFTAGIDNGQEKSGNTVPEVSGTINISKGKTATISSAALNNIVGDVNIAADAILKIATASENKLKGTITINGKLQKDQSGAMTNNGTIDNYGTLACPVTNNGLIIVEKNSISDKTNATISGTGSIKVIDVTTFSALQSSQDRASQQYNITGGTVTTEVNNAVEYTAADISVIDNITLNGGEWTLADATGTSTTSKDIAVPTNAESLTLKVATLKGNGKTLANKNIYVEGVSSIAGGATISGCNLNMAEGSSLSVGNGVTVNGLASTTQTATINGALTVKAGAKMYFGEVTVGQKGKVIVEGDLNATVNCAEFGVKTTFTNNGYVESSAAVEKNGDAGKVSQPTNGATGTFKGNAADSDFSWS